jgi:hypothetical protein
MHMVETGSRFGSTTCCSATTCARTRSGGRVRTSQARLAARYNAALSAHSEINGDYGPQDRVHRGDQGAERARRIGGYSSSWRCAAPPPTSAPHPRGGRSPEFGSVSSAGAQRVSTVRECSRGGCDPSRRAPPSSVAQSTSLVGTFSIDQAAALSPVYPATWTHARGRRGAQERTPIRNHRIARDEFQYPRA